MVDRYCASMRQIQEGLEWACDSPRVLGPAQVSRREALVCSELAKKNPGTNL